MAAIKRLGANGVVSDYTQLDQYADFLANQFGITDILQTNLGSLYVPVQSGAPSSPIAGQVWLDTSVGSGRLYLRDNASNTYAMLACRQVQKSAEVGSLTTTSSSLSNATGLAITNFSTTGGRLRIKLVPIAAYSPATGYVFLQASGGATALATGEIVPVVNGVSLGANVIQVQGQAASLPALEIPVSAFEWDYVPPANLTNVTIQLQFRVTGANMTLQISSAALLVEEWGN